MNISGHIFYSPVHNIKSITPEYFQLNWSGDTVEENLWYLPLHIFCYQIYLSKLIKIENRLNINVLWILTECYSTAH